MPKAGSSKLVNRSKSAEDASQKGKGRPTKIIQRTIDLVKSNDQRKKSRKGKGKEEEALGDLANSVEQRKSMPSGVQVERFAEARALEILALQNAIKTAASLGSTRAFQSLPRHLRRRAASHNPRRVPKRYRSRAAAEIQPSDNIAKLHRKRAKLRAKGNLQGQSRTEQLLERQRNKTWLPTHIWHAKRFHMTNIWVYRLARTPTLKSFRPAYRAATRKAIVNDVSYFGTTELVGKRDDIVRLLSRVVVGHFAGSRYESGARVARALLYGDQGFPYELLGPVEIIWKPGEEDHTDRTVWLRVHPAICDRVKSLMITLLSSPDNQESASSSTTLPNPLVQLHDLTGEIDSFEIMGPKAARVLRRILRLTRSESKEKASFFESLRNVQSAEIPEGLIAGLLIHDPRLIFPAPVLSTQRPATSYDDIARSSAPEPTPTLAASSIWDPDIRDDLSTPRFKKSDLDRRRQKNGIPGAQLRPTTQDDRIPILLLQRSLTSSAAGGGQERLMSGFTLLVPRGWSMYLLNSFVYAGCMVGGLVERRNQYRETGMPSFPEHYGSTCQAGRDWEETKAAEEKARWDKKPPAKRPQFAALGTSSPWKPDWTAILRGSDEEDAMNGNGAVFQQWLVTGPILFLLDALWTRSEPPQATLLKIVNSFRQQRDCILIPTSGADDLYSSALLHVRLEVEARGSPGDMAVIYSLNETERADWLAAKDKDGKHGRGDWDHDDPRRDMQKLGELAPDPSATIGYTSTGNFSMTRGRGFALATVSLKGYVQLAQQAGPEGVLVKVKNRDGRLCRLAKVDLV